MYFNEIIAKEESKSVRTVLIEQKKRFDALKKQKFFNNLADKVENDEVMLLPDTLLHGTKFDMNTLKGIKKNGILASEFAHAKPDFYRETFYMADFFKNVTGKELPVHEALTSFNKNYVINYLPEVSDKTGENRVAFVVNTSDKRIKKYLELDLFSEKNEQLLPFIDEEMYLSIQRRKIFYYYNFKLGQSSIPLGVPYSCLSGVIVDNEIEKNEEKLKIIKNLFGKELVIISSSGKILMKPALESEQNEETLSKTFY